MDLHAVKVIFALLLTLGAVVVGLLHGPAYSMAVILWGMFWVLIVESK